MTDRKKNPTRWHLQRMLDTDRHSPEWWEAYDDYRKAAGLPPVPQRLRATRKQARSRPPPFDFDKHEQCVRLGCS